MSKMILIDKGTVKLALETLELFITPNWAGAGVDKANEAHAALREALTSVPDWASAAKEQPAQQQEPVAWRDHVEQRLLTWRQSFVNKSGDQLALDDFMDKRSLDDLIDFVCSDYTSPPPYKPWVGLTDEDKSELDEKYGDDMLAHLDAIEAKLKEKNT